MSYLHDYSRSEGAAQAEKDGFFPASTLCKLLKNGIIPSAVKTVLEPTEAHHTSCRFNLTDFYSIEDAKEQIDALILASHQPKLPETITITEGTAKVEYWEGTRKHPRRIEKIIAGKFFHTPHTQCSYVRTRTVIHQFLIPCK